MIIPTDKKGEARKLNLTNIEVKDMIYELSRKNVELSISKNTSTQRERLVIEHERVMNLGAIEILWSLLRNH